MWRAVKDLPVAGRGATTLEASAAEPLCAAGDHRRAVIAVAGTVAIGDGTDATAEPVQDEVAGASRMRSVAAAMRSYARGAWCRAA